MIIYLSFIICSIALIYPYVIYPIILKFIKSQPIARKDGHKLSATLVFCAYNEEAALPEKLANIEMLKAKHKDLQVLAFDDGSSDRSSEMLAERTDLLTLIQGGGRNGKAHGMKLLAAKATGDIMIFTDANVTLKEDAIDNLMAWYADPDVGGICGSLHYLGADETSTGQVGGLYWKLEEYLKSEESRTGNVMGGDGSIFSLRRKYYPEFPDTVLDDLTVSMAAVFNRKRLIKVEDVIAYENLVAERGDEVRRKMRISARAYHTHTFLRPNLKKMQAMDKFKYFSRKTLRWFGGTFMVLAAISFLISAYLISPIFAVVALTLMIGAIILGIKTVKGPIASIYDIAIAILATQVGIFKAMRGNTYAVWNPAKSR